MKCYNCNHDLPPGAAFCPRCGRAQTIYRDPIAIPPGSTDYSTILEPQSPVAGGSRPGNPVPPANGNGTVNPAPPPIRSSPADLTVRAQRPGNPVPPVQGPVNPPAPAQGPVYPPYPPRRKPRWLIPLVIILFILLLAGSIYGVLNYTRNSGNGSGVTATATPSKPSFLVTLAPDKEPIGISDGTFAFDTNRLDGNLKSQAAAKLKKGDSSGAESLWKQALAIDTNDGETLIYQEDQRILDTHRSYFTLVAGTILTGDFSGTGRDSLQGAYIAQKEYNKKCSQLPDCVELRLLVANSGTGDSVSAGVAYASLIMERIVQAARSDSTIVGVMGWPVSSGSLYVATLLGAAHIPMVSPTASIGASTQISSYYFRVAPSNKSQGIVGAQYAELTLHARHVAVFVDPVDKYSENLADEFERQFTADGNTIVAIENYTVGNPDSVSSRIQDALGNNPDLIYFAGHSNDVGALLTGLPTSGPFANVQVLGGDALYEVKGYPADVKGKLYRLHFTAFAYPDEWKVLAPSEQQPAFFDDYPQTFDPEGKHGGEYGYERADNGAILSYDAMQALLTASTLAFGGGKLSFTADDLQRALTQIAASQAVQGASGQISFGTDGNPTNKVIVVLHFDTGNHIHFDKAYGCFLKPLVTTPSNSSCS